MSILARFTNFLDFYGFQKAVATAFLGITTLFLVICSKFFSLLTQIYAMGSWIKG